MNITSWDTHGDEQKYLGGLYDALLLKKNLALTEKLLLGLDETWFTDPYHRQLFLAAFRNATLAYDPDSRVTITGVLDDAERELGETGWARDVFQRCSEAAGIFEPQRFLDEEAPLWWEKQKRQKIQQALAKADQLLAVPPRQETMGDVRDYLTAAIGTVDQEPLCGQESENAVMRAWNEFLEPLAAGDHDQHRHEMHGRRSGRRLVRTRRPGWREADHRDGEARRRQDTALRSTWRCG